MTTESTEKANRSVWIAILGYIPLGYAFYFIGTGLFVFNQVRPDAQMKALVDAGRADALYAYFVGAYMPAGAGGLVIAAFFAATMSTVSAVINSSSTVFIQDFYKRLSRTQRSDRHYLNLARGSTVLWGVLATVMAVLLAGHAGLAQIAWAKIMSATASGVLGLMALAFLPFRVNKWAALIGFGACYVSLACLAWLTRINFLLWPVIDNLVCFFVALGVDRLFCAWAGRTSRP
jgi:Na+/proline symporter